MFHTVYKTINLVNGKYYFGVHKTEYPNDGYLGSGVYIKNAIAKYGADKFRKDVLFIYVDSESAFAKEKELVAAFHDDPYCKNLRQGGTGGFDFINRQGKHSQAKLTAEQVIEIRRKAAEEGRFAKELAEEFGVSQNHILLILRGEKWIKITGGTPAVKKWRHPKYGPYSKERRAKQSTTQKARFAELKAAGVAIYVPSNLGKKHSEITKQRICDANRKKAKRGTDSPNFGTHMSLEAKQRLSASQKVRWQRAKESGASSRYKFTNQFGLCEG